jgi:hypothetical protein
VYLYILSTPFGNGLGCFKAGMAAMAEDLRMTPDRFAEGFGEGFDERLGEPLFLYDENARVVFIPKYLERNPPSNPNGIRALSKSFLSVPDCKLKHDCYQTVRAFVDGKSNEPKKGGETFIDAFLRTFVEPSFNHDGNLRQTMMATFAKPPGINTPSCSLPLSLTSSSQKEEDLCRPEADRSSAKDFDVFYSAYPKHEDKTDAQKAWKTTAGKRPSLEVILSAIEAQKKGDKWTRGFIKSPASWLRKGSWEDEVEAPQQASAGQFQQQWRGGHNEPEQPPRKIVDLTEVVAKMADRLGRE